MDPILGQLGLFGFGFAPKGWAMCNGQLVPINQNQALFSLLGTMYGGDGITTFALPNLRGRTPLHFNSTFVQGQSGGEESHTLVTGEMPTHTHTAACSSATASTADPTNAFWADGGQTSYSPNKDSVMASGAVSTVGNNQPHENRSPLLTINICIALVGVFPSRN